MKPSRRRRPARIAIMLNLYADGAVIGYPIVETDREQVELARRLRRLASSIIESPSLAERLAGLPPDLSR
jgi:hypothetical protein